jgi:hypothetical protein
MPVIPATQDAEARRSQVQGQPGPKVILYLQNNKSKKRWVGGKLFGLVQSHSQVFLRVLLYIPHVRD